METIKWNEYNRTLEVITFSSILDEIMQKYEDVKRLMEDNDFKTALTKHEKPCKLCEYHACTWVDKKDRKPCPLLTLDVCGYRHSTHAWISEILGRYAKYGSRPSTFDQQRVMEGVNEIINMVQEIKRKINGVTTA